MRPRSAKPRELLNLHQVSGEAFLVLRREFKVPETFSFSLEDVDGLTDCQIADVDTAAFAMRQLQLIRRYASPGHVARTDQIINIVAHLERSLARLLRTTADAQVISMLANTRSLLHDASWAIVRDSGGLSDGATEWY